MTASQLPTQRPLVEQLRDLAVVANQKGMYDAADFIWRHVEATEAKMLLAEQRSKGDAAK